MKSPDFNTIVDQITDLIDWYRGHSHDASITGLLDFQDKLSTYAANLSEIYAKYSLIYSIEYIQRKYTFAVEKQAHRNANKTVSDADDWAEQKVFEKRKKEVYAYEIAQKLQLLRQDVRQVLQVCTQRISFLKLEYEQNKYSANA